VPLTTRPPRPHYWRPAPGTAALVPEYVSCGDVVPEQGAVALGHVAEPLPSDGEGLGDDVRSVFGAVCSAERVRQDPRPRREHGSARAARRPSAPCSSRRRGSLSLMPMGMFHVSCTALLAFEVSVRRGRRYHREVVPRSRRSGVVIVWVRFANRRRPLGASPACGTSPQVSPRVSPALQRRS